MPAGSTRVNGAPVDLSEVPDDERLLDTLRWRLALRGTKEGCRTGDCGACTVLLDGRSALSCLTLTHEVEGASVTTVEAIANGRIGEAVRDAFIAEGAAQCGYCTPGFVVALTGLLAERRASTPVSDLLEEMGGNLCRCTGYGTIGRAIVRAREAIR
ncbi:MAG: (2Fe-2S)-binding protein [Thermoplasmata archaeon]|nr:(2Fe-2S)-binding protein [Thermoplasmata archaeon]